MENIGIDLKELKIYEFEEIKERLFFKLLNQEACSEIIEKGPIVRILDLVGVYGLLLNTDDEGSMTMQVNHKMFERWGVGEEELFRCALENTKNIFGIKVVELSKIFEEYVHSLNIEGLDKDSLSEEMYVLTNDNSTYGATTVLVPEVLKKLSTKLGRDLILIPSSVHEMMAFGYDDKYSIHELNNLIKEVNSTMNIAETLSDHAYLYHRADDKLSIPKV